MARFDLLTQFPEWLKSFLDSPTPEAPVTYDEAALEAMEALNG